MTAMLTGVSTLIAIAVTVVVAAVTMTLVAITTVMSAIVVGITVVAAVIVSAMAAVMAIIVMRGNQCRNADGECDADGGVVAIVVPIVVALTR